MRQRVRRLVGIGGADEAQAGHGAQRGQLLDGLMGGAVLAQADRVVGPGIDDVGVGERGKADGGTHVVAEDEERAAHGEDAAVARHAGHGRRHGVLADPEVDLGTTGSLGGLVDGVVELHPRVAGEVGRARHQPGDGVGGGVDALVDRHPGGDARAHLEHREALRPSRQPPAALARLPYRLVAVPAVEAGLPPLPVGLAAPEGTPVVLDHLVGDPEGLVGGEPEDGLGLADLVLAQRGPRGRRRCRSCGERASRCGCAAGSSTACPRRPWPAGARLRGRRCRWPPRRCCRCASRRRRSARPRCRCRPVRWGRRW